MAGGKETPRQRMIGILYLVLLGLIALEAPANLLDAFKRIGDSLATSKTNVQTGIDNTFDAFRKTKLVQQPDRAKPIYEKALSASELADKLNNDVERLKKIMIERSGGFDPATNDYKGREDVDVPNHLMVADGGDKEGKKLRDEINDTRNEMLSKLSDKERVGVNLSLQADDPPHVTGFPDKTWEQANFGDGIPVGAAVTNLIKIQSDIKNSENEVVKKILGEVDQAVVNLDKFSAVAVAPSSYILVGNPYTAEVFLTASDSKSSPDITVGGSKLPVSDGKGKYVGSTSSEGLHTWTGTIRVKQNDGTFKEYSTPPQTYMVARPSAVVSPDKMLVLYIGLPNPLSVSAPGVGKESISVNISSGSIKGSGGNYTAEVNTIGEATVTVSGKVGVGPAAKTMVLGSTKFRVKRIPDPKAQYAGVNSGSSTSTGNLKGQTTLFAKLDNFEFDAHFTVKAFTLIVIKPRQDAVTIPGSGANLNGQMLSMMNGITPGTTVVFKDIIAVGPDGKDRAIDPWVVTTK